MTFDVECVRFSERDYHVYNDVWAATIGKQLPCQSKQGNAKDVFVVAVLKDRVIVSHVP